MSYYYDKKCNRLLTSQGGMHAIKHGVRLGEEPIVLLGTAYWKNNRRDPEAVKLVIAKLELLTHRRATADEIKFIEK